MNQLQMPIPEFLARDFGTDDLLKVTGQSRFLTEHHERGAPSALPSETTPAKATYNATYQQKDQLTRVGM